MKYPPKRQVQNALKTAEDLMYQGSPLGSVFMPILEHYVELRAADRTCQGCDNWESECQPDVCSKCTCERIGE